MNYITNINQADEFLTKLYGAESVGLDVESTSLDPFTGQLLLLQISIDGTAYVFDARKLGIRYIRYIVDLLRGGNVEVIAHNALFDIFFLKVKTGIMLENVYCTQIAESIITGGEKRYSSLNDLIYKYFHGMEEQIDKETRDLFINLKEDEPITQEMIIYSAKDVVHLEDIVDLQKEIIDKEGMNNILRLESKLIPVIASMKENGVKLDSESWMELFEISKQKKNEFENKVKNTIIDLIKDKVDNLKIIKDDANPVWDRLQKKIDKYKTIEYTYEDLEYGKEIKVDNVYKLLQYLFIPVDSLGDIKQLERIPLINFEFVEDILIEQINIDSPLQIKRVLNVVGIGVENTQEDTLKSQELNKDLNEKQIYLIESLLSFKEYSKRVSSFGENILEYINPKTGRIHASVFQIGTKTGRFAYSEPNLQQIPGDKEFRQCFIAEEGNVLITSDYSQQELRYVGDLSEDEVIIDAYRHNKDIHRITASAIFDVPYEEVNKEQRGRGKTLNFQTIYGATKWGISRKMEIPLDEAEKFLNRYFDKYRYLSVFKELVEEEVVRNMYSTTPLGRKRFFKIDEEKAFVERKKDPYYDEKLISSIKREGFNHPIQGGCADMLKQALNYIYYNNPFGDKLKIIMVIHDEVVVEAEETIAEEAQEFIVSSMNRSGNEMMEHIKAETDSSICKYWSK